MVYEADKRRCFGRKIGGEFWAYLSRQAWMICSPGTMTRRASSLSSPVTMFWLMTKGGLLVTSRERAARVLAELQNLASAGKRYGN